MSMLGKMPKVVSMPTLPADVQNDPFFTGTMGPSEFVATDLGANSYALVRAQDGALAIDGGSQTSPVGREIDDFITVVPRGENPLQVQKAGFEVADVFFYGGVLVGGGLAVSAGYVIVKRFLGWLIDKSFRQSHDVGSARDAFCNMVLDYNRINKKTEPNWVSRFFKKTFVVSRGLLATVRRASGIKRRPEDDIKKEVDGVIRQYWPETYNHLGNVERSSQQLAGQLGLSPNWERPFPSLSLSEVYGQRADDLPDWIVTRLYNKDMAAVNQYRELVTVVMQRFRNAIMGVQIPADAGSGEMLRITQGIECALEQSEQYLKLLEELKAANQGLKTVLSNAGRGYIVFPKVDEAWFRIIREVEPKIEATLEFLTPRQDRLGQAVQSNSLPPTTDLHQFSTVERLLSSVVRVSSKPAQFKGVELMLDTKTLEKIGFIKIPLAVQPILHETLTTIVDNAIAHSSPSLRFDGAQAEVAACVEDQGGELHVTVTDNGLGINSLERVRAGDGPLSQILQLIDEQDGISIEYKALTSLTRGHYGTKFTITVELPVEDDSYDGFPDQDSIPPWLS